MLYLSIDAHLFPLFSTLFYWHMWIDGLCDTSEYMRISAIVVWMSSLHFQASEKWSSMIFHCTIHFFYSIWNESDCIFNGQNWPDWTMYYELSSIWFCFWVLFESHSIQSNFIRFPYIFRNVSKLWWMKNRLNRKSWKRKTAFISSIMNRHWNLIIQMDRWHEAYKTLIVYYTMFHVISSRVLRRHTKLWWLELNGIGNYAPIPMVPLDLN